MAFVNEKLTEQDKEFVAGFQFERPWQKYMLADVPDEWAADRENKYYLIGLGGQGWRSYDTEEYPPNYYRLIIGDRVVKIQARLRLKGNSKVGVTVYWKLTSISGTRGMELKEDELAGIITEAFAAYASVLTNNHAIASIIEYMDSFRI